MKPTVRVITDETRDEWLGVLAHVDAFFPGGDELLLEEARTYGGEAGS